MSLTYAWEKFRLAVLGMAQSDARVQQKVADAFVGSLIRIRPEEDLPDDLQKRFADLHTAVTRQSPKADEGTLQATADVMDEREARRHIETIVSLYDHICRLEGPMA